LYDTFEAEKDIIAVYLFGSVARGDFSIRHSDLDLFVILDQRKPLSKTVKQMENTIKGIAFQEGVRAHLEFQGLEVNDEDRSLLRKVMEEGRLIFSRGFVAFDKYKIGLKPFLLYHFSVINKENRARFSQILHGYTSFYYKDTTTGKKLSKEKILKEYKGIIDGRDIIEAGKGALLVAKEKEKYITKLFVDFSVEYKQIRMIYLE
jgi:predicted nucleotidyltransferase